MVKSKDYHVTIIILISIVVVVLLFIYGLIHFIYKRPSIDDIWLINLEKDGDRLKSVRSQEHLLPQPIQRWEASYGKDLNRNELAKKDGVQTIISRSTDLDQNKQSNKVLSRAGEIGCWVSHKRLLRHLYSLSVSSSTGHLILEDDIVIPQDFIPRWNAISATIPTDWDIVYLGIGGIHGDRINENVVKWKNDKDDGNWGTFAYLVRHGSIGKILDTLTLMGGPIDVQYFKMLSHLNIYIVDPGLITVNSDFTSSIERQEMR